MMMLLAQDLAGQITASEDLKFLGREYSKDVLVCP